MPERVISELNPIRHIFVKRLVFTLAETLIVGISASAIDQPCTRLLLTLTPYRYRAQATCRIGNDDLSLAF